jgi:hypothetical protein
LWGLALNCDPPDLCLQLKSSVTMPATENWFDWEKSLSNKIVYVWEVKIVKFVTLKMLEILTSIERGHVKSR